MEGKENFNQNTFEKIQSIEDFSFEEVEPNTEGAIGVFAKPEEQLEIVKSKIIRELKEKNWWLQDEYKNEGFPKEQFLVKGDKNEYPIYNFNNDLSKEQLGSLNKGISFIENSTQSPLLNGINVLIRKTERINPQSKQPSYGRYDSNPRVITIFPRALENISYREIPEVNGLEATIVHEFSHPIWDKLGELKDDWYKFVDWEPATLEDKTENDMRYTKPTNPERCITTYAQFAEDEDFCESVVGLCAQSSKLDPEKKAFLENNIFNQLEKTPLVKISKKEKVELPKINTQIKFFRKKPISIIKKNIEEIPEKENNLDTLNFNDLVASTISKGHLELNKFYEPKDNSNKIVRVESFDELLDKHDNKIGIPELIETTKKLYKELEEKYGIVTPVDFATSKDNDGKEFVCVITDKIEGQNLEKVEKSDEFVSKAEKLYSSIAKYFLDKSKDGGLYIWDINGESQYIYGKKLGDKEYKIYLIDTDIWLSKNKNDMYLSVYWLARHMSWLESKLGVKFIEARNSINEFINQPLSKDVDESVEKNFEGIKKIMAGEKSEYNPKSAIPRFE
jgi:hypothetical protein